MPRITNAERTRLFGRPGDRSYLVTVETPWGIRVPVHRAIVGVFQAACREAERVAWNPQRIDSFNPRPIRGSTEWSIHSWALAFDFFATPPGVPPPGGVWTPHNGVPADFARAFTTRGFTWGATFNRKDVPHIEWAGPPPTGQDQEEEMTPEQEAKVGGWMQEQADRVIKEVNGKAAEDRRVIVEDLDDIKARLAALEAKVG